MFYRASKFYFQFSKALKNKCFVCRNQSLIGNISNSAKHKGVPIRSGPPKKLVTPSRIGGFSFSLIGLKSLQQYKVICEENYNNEAPIVKVKNISNWKKLAYLIYLDIWCWIGALVTAIFVAYINIQLPLCLGDLANIIANMAKESSRTLMEELNLPVGKLIVLYLAQAFGTFVYISLLSRAGENLAEKLKCDLYNAIIRQDIAFFDTRRTGELLDCLFSDVQEFKSSFKQCVSQGVKNVLQICGCVLSLFKISPAMTCTVLTIVPAIIVAGSIFGMLLRKISQAAQIESVKTFTMSEEVLSNIRTVRSFSSEALECEKFRDQLQRTSYMNSVLGYGIGFFQAGTNLFLNGLVLGTLYIGSRYVVSDNLSPGRLMSFLVTAQIIQKSFAQLSLIFGHVIKGKQAFQRVCYVFVACVLLTASIKAGIHVPPFQIAVVPLFTNLKPTIPTSGGIKIPFHSLIPTIEFKDVTFAYPTRPKQDILQNLNLTLPAGKTVAVVGASGNGKSTIALLLERFYDVSSGSITLNNIDIRKLDPHWLRGTVIGIINQEPVLFATTVKENIRYGKPNATDEEVYEAARQANADDFIRKFPEGYDTLVGERGVSVSGGQKQRIAIARALIKKPSILILDEATSALDPDSEKVVQETLEKVCQGRTVLVIAHRLSTVRNADIIAVLNKGIILEMGSHDQLMKQKGVYYGMMSQQRTFPSRFFSSG